MENKIKEKVLEIINSELPEPKTVSAKETSPIPYRIRKSTKKKVRGMVRKTKSVSYDEMLTKLDLILKEVI